MGYADDVDIVGRTLTEMGEVCKNWEVTAGSVRLQVNQEKNSDVDTVQNQITSLWGRVNLMQRKNLNIILSVWISNSNGWI
jgi:hypothetical protein